MSTHSQILTSLQVQCLGALLTLNALEHATSIAGAYVLYFIVMMASMTALGLVYVIINGTTGLELGLVVGTAIMTAGTIPILRRSARANALLSENRESVMLKSFLVRGVLVSLILFNELLMGWAFVLASGTPALSYSRSAFQNALTSFATVTGSDWFIFTMALEMMFTIYMLRNNFQRNLIPIFVLQAAVMFLAPTAIVNQSWSSTSIYLGSVAMVGLMVLMLEHLYKQRMVDSPTRAYFLGLMSLMAVMMAGLFLWIIQGNELLFVSSIIG